MPFRAVWHFIGCLAVLHAFGAESVAQAPPVPAHRSLTFEDRVAAQLAIEQVYWNHRNWPKENPGRKPPLSTMISDKLIRERVEDYLRKSNALDTWWHRPITGDQLQAELGRMAAHTQDGAMLQEIFHALGDDPFRIAETFARQTLTDRLIRTWYANDVRFHGAPRAKVDAAIGACAGVDCMRSMGGEYRVTEWALRTENRPPSAEPDVAEIPLDRDEWKEHLDHLSSAFGASGGTLPTGKLSAIEETADAFIVTALIEQSNARLKIATVTWPKRTFDAWWRVAGPAEATQVESEFRAMRLPQISSSACIDNTWSTMFTLGAPIEHKAVWTGAEMIVWGGWVNTGLRYDPAADSWTRTSIGTNVPAARFGHTAVWTGTEMIVWGGSPNGATYFNTGGRYDPFADAWMPTSIGVNVPDAREYHSAVWTGTQMIVWGGLGDFGYLNTGGRYTPSTNSWAATPVAANVPVGRYFHSAVWTGTQMIIWGGSGFVYLNSGARYDPATNSWSPTSAGANVPTARRSHTCVWTGSEMIVWGGADSSSVFKTGGRYDPTTDTWMATSVGTNAPPASTLHTAVWTGTEMIVWGGNSYDNIGRRYDPAADSWSLAATLNAPQARQTHTAVWTGTEMIVWGGQTSSSRQLNTGGRYNPATDSWAPTSTLNVPAARYSSAAIWTGAEMIVWGGAGVALFNTGGRYDLASDTWRPSSTLNAPAARYTHTAVWTGVEMIVWGGADGGSSTYFNTGGRYNPASDSWTPTSTTSNVPTGRIASAIWTGTEMIVWGGFNSSGYLASGGRYAPSTDTWVATSSGPNLPVGRAGNSAVWTGSEMIVWGGYYYDSGDRYPNNAGRYSPSTDSWLATSSGANVPSGRNGHTAVWTGTEMIVWGGSGSDGANINTGGRYNPSTDSWLATSTGASVPSARRAHAALWTGTEMLVWGGQTFSLSRANTGGRYTPSSNSWTSTSVGSNVPLPRDSFASVWTGTEMLVWGGRGESSISTYLDSGGRYCVCPSRRTTFRDSDGDGYGDPGSSVDSCFGSIPSGYVGNSSDCNDANPSVFPGSQEINDGIDNQCPGDAGSGMTDELDDSGSFAVDKTTLSWTGQQGATSYQLVRSTTPDFTVACTSLTATLPSFQDPEVPAQGAAFYYVARAAAPFPGSWGKTSLGTERTPGCP
jgi:N-acetylneuraminic acid mutarotase